MQNREFILSSLKYRIAAFSIVGLLGSANVPATLSVVQEQPIQEARVGETPAAAEESTKELKSEKKARSGVSDEQRQAAMTFAEQNHPELARLLEQLQKSRPNESARAIKELTQQIQALERLREKSPARYASQLEAWQHESQIRVLMARWARSHDAELETQIRELLKARREARLAQLRSDKERLLEQQQKIEQQLAAMEQPEDELVDKEWEQLSKKAAARKDMGKKPAKPAADETR
jgi:hypothetical protein